jgi:hypothetical protein
MQPSNSSPEVTAQPSGRLMSYINARDGHALDAYPFVHVHTGTCWPAVLVLKAWRAGVRFEGPDLVVHLARRYAPPCPRVLHRPTVDSKLPHLLCS